MRFIAFVTIVSLVMADMAVAAVDPIEKELKEKNLQAKAAYDNALKANLDEAVKSYQRDMAKQKRTGNFKKALDIQNQINKVLGREVIVMNFDADETVDTAAAVKAAADQTAKFKKGAEEINKRLFKLFVEPKPLSWEVAKTRCELMGGHLASIGNRDEDNAIAELCKKSAGAYVPAWIGASREKETAPWQWVDGSKTGFYYWAPDEPVNKEGFTRIIINANGQRGLWATKADSPTPPIQYYICVWEPVRKAKR